VGSADNGAVFDCVVTNQAGGVTSIPAPLNVTSVVLAPNISSQPSNQTVATGQGATFSVSASGTAPLSYQWLRNGVAIAGATNQILTVSPATILNDLDSYQVSVSNTAGTVLSDPTTLSVSSQQIDLIAGTLGGSGRVDGLGLAARFTAPGMLMSDNAGNIYISDNGSVRKATSTGTISTVAGKNGDIGYVDGPSTTARFGANVSFALHASGDVFVFDTGNHVIRRIDNFGNVSTYAGTGGSGATDGNVGTAQLGDPMAGVFDSNGNLFFVDGRNCSVRKISAVGTVSTFAGLAGGSPCAFADGTASAARFIFPAGIAIDAMDNLYVADQGNNRIRKITPAAVVTTLAGNGNSGCANVDGTGSLAEFCAPYGIAIDAASNVYTTDFRNTIRKTTPAGLVTTIAGTGILGSGQYADGQGTAAGFSHPLGIVADASGNLVVADTENVSLRRINTSGMVSTWAGTPAHSGFSNGAGGVLFNRPTGVCGDSSGSVFVADSGNQVIRKISLNGTVSTFAGASGSRGSSDGPGAFARFSDPTDIACDSSGNLYVSDTSNYTVRKITSSGVVSTLAGSAGQQGSVDGAGANARFAYPAGIDVDGAGNVYLADYGNKTVRKITPSGVVTTLAGNGSDGCIDGAAANASFSFLWGLAVDHIGNVFVTDDYKMVRKISTSGMVTTFAGSCSAFPAVADGTGSNANFVRAVDLAIDSTQNIYVAEAIYPSLGGGVIRKITPSAVVTTIAGTPTNSSIPWGVALGLLPGSLSEPLGVAVLPSGGGTKLAVTDENSVLSITLP
jgi:sugar lactone lactonase YvrE